MTTITFNDDSIHLHKHSIAIRFKSPDAADAGESKSTPDNLAIDMIDKMVAKINEINKDIISKYDYNIVKEGEEFEVCILWKHIFKKFNEPQRFCYLKFLYVKEKKVLLFYDIDSCKFPFRIPANAVKIPVKNGAINITTEKMQQDYDCDNADNVDDKLTELMIKYSCYHTVVSKNKAMIENFISSSILNSIDELKDCIRFEKGKLLFSF
jgi:hypothetical protein